MLEFYEKTGIELHIFVTEMNEFEYIDISYKTHADWTVVDAVYASCSVPLIFSPIIRNNKCYIDGSLCMNYPLIKCINDVGHDKKDEILGVLLLYEENLKHTKPCISESSSFFDYIILVLQRFLQCRFFMTDVSCKIPHEIRMSSPDFTLEYINKCC
jgi:hypothetical protein